MKPRDPDALFGMGQIAGMEGRFDESEKFLKRALEASPKMPAAWAELARLRKMTSGDDAWLRTVEQIAGERSFAHAISHPPFCHGKYNDDIGQFEQAFKKIQDCQRTAEAYRRKLRSRGAKKFG